MNILISFLYLLLYLAVVIFVAFAVRWVIVGFMKWPLDADVEKWGRVIVGLICLIAIVVWLTGVIGWGPGLPHPIFR